ncbi:MAG TPA: hypothetical protein VGR57_21810 [Ktedonobacterales bacterium]|nr:hypothetical protein [Ktedonobacterales bacterium]
MNGQETPWPSGVEAAPDAGAAADAGHPAWAAAPLAGPHVTQPTAETLQALATPRVPDMPAESLAGASAPEGVGTLRAILLGNLGNSAPADQPERLAHIERRLDELAAQQERTQAVARGGDGTLASLAHLQQQVADLRQRAETVPIQREAVLGADEVAELRRQVEDLRRSQAHQTGAFLEELRQSEARCQLRQRRARPASRMELAALRRRVYAPQLAPRPSALPRAAMPAPGVPTAYASPNARPVAAQGTAGLNWRPASQGAPAQPARGRRHAPPQTGSEAWSEVWRTLVAFLAALWAMIALLGRMLGEDLKDAWIGLGDIWRRG